jgi:hypothetical protein
VTSCDDVSLIETLASVPSILHLAMGSFHYSVFTVLPCPIQPDPLAIRSPAKSRAAKGCKMTTVVICARPRKKVWCFPWPSNFRSHCIAAHQSSRQTRDMANMVYATRDACRLPNGSIVPPSHCPRSVGSDRFRFGRIQPACAPPPSPSSPSVHGPVSDGEQQLCHRQLLTGLRQVFLPKLVGDRAAFYSLARVLDPRGLVNRFPSRTNWWAHGRGVWQV